MSDIEALLTDRELEVQDLIAEGKNYEAIANELHISKETVKRHTDKVYRKRGVKSRLELAVVIWKERLSQVKQIDSVVVAFPKLAPGILQPKEFQMCALIAKGLTFAEVAKRLDVKTTSVSQYLYCIRKKLKVSRRKDLANWFKKHYPTDESIRHGYASACIAFAESWATSRKKAREINKAHRAWVNDDHSLIKCPRVSYALDNIKPEDSLTPNEFKVCELLADGKKKQEIAEVLQIKEHSIHKYLSGCYSKTGQESQLQLVVWFLARYPTEEDRKKGYLFACELSKRVAKQSHITASILKSLGKH